MAVENPSSNQDTFSLGGVRASYKMGALSIAGVTRLHPTTARALRDWLNSVLPVETSEPRDHGEPVPDNMSFEQLLADARRYRFLRQPGNAIVYAKDRNAWGEGASGYVRYAEAHQLDEAIDGAMSKSKPLETSKNATPGATLVGESSVGLGAEDSRPRELHDEECANCGAPWSKHLTNQLICPDAAIADVYRFRQESPEKATAPIPAPETSIAETFARSPRRVDEGSKSVGDKHDPS